MKQFEKEFNGIKIISDINGLEGKNGKRPFNSDDLESIIFNSPELRKKYNGTTNKPWNLIANELKEKGIQTLELYNNKGELALKLNDKKK